MASDYCWWQNFIPVTGSLSSYLITICYSHVNFPFYQYWGVNLGSVLTRQMLCHLSQASTPVLLQLFFKQYLVFLPMSSHVTGITGTCQHWTCWLRQDLGNFLPQKAFTCDTPDLHLPISWDYCVSEHAQLKLLFFLILLFYVLMSQYLPTCSFLQQVQK